MAFGKIFYQCLQRDFSLFDIQWGCIIKDVVERRLEVTSKRHRSIGYVEKNASEFNRYPPISLLRAEWSSFLPGVTYRPAHLPDSLVFDIILHDDVPRLFLREPSLIAIAHPSLIALTRS
jgi:hypothetical protein